MIALKEPRPPVSAAQLAEAETRLAALGMPIPPSYKAFLAAQDGGKPVRNSFSFEQRGRQQHDLVRLFFGIGPSANGDLVGKAATARDDVPAGVLPIAADSFGNLILIDGRNGGDGPIVFWDHEEGFDDGEPDYSNLYEVAPDLETFLDGLTEPKPPPIAPKRKRSGWRRLLGR